jgi:hypothetical protein
VQREGLENVHRHAADDARSVADQCDSSNGLDLPPELESIITWGARKLADRTALRLAGELVSRDEMIDLASETIEAIVDDIIETLGATGMAHIRAAIARSMRSHFSERALVLLERMQVGGRA